MNKVAVITGGTRGIGRAISLTLAQNGYSICTCYKSNTCSAKSLICELEKLGVEYIVEQADIADTKMADSFCKHIIQKFGHVDVLVNNASITHDSLFCDKNCCDMQNVFNTNVTGTFYISKILGNYMYDAKHGCIITIASTNGINTYFPMCIEYDASKSAQISIMHNLAIQFAPFVRSVAIAPGFIATDSEIDGMGDEYINSEVDKILVKRAGTEQDIANAVEFLCSDKATFINNTVIRIDGGQYGA